MKSLEFGEKIYSYTNENLTAYGELYNFSGKSVLSVLGSGDQFFTFLLFGAKNIDLFDINNRTNYYFALKYYSILNLTYEEFMEFVVKSNYGNEYLYDKVSGYLPENIRKYFDSMLKRNIQLSYYILNNLLNSNIINLNTRRVIPYFDKELFYILKSILEKTEYPKIYNYSLEELYKYLDSKYDLMFFSNIFMYLNCSVKDYKVLLNKYLKLLNDGGEIQANYYWGKNLDLNKSFKSFGLICDEIPSVRYLPRGPLFKDYVFTLRKK